MLILTSMNLSSIVLIGVVIGMFALAFILLNKKEQKSSPKKLPEKPRTPISPKHFMSNHEITMFHELRQSVPELYIFPQVALSAILQTTGQGTRNKFNQKRADYVITDQDFTILAVIELDDKSHAGKEAKDAERDSMVREAGYKVLRYRYMPDKEKLRADILG